MKKFLVGLIIAMLGTLGIGLLCKKFLQPDTTQQIVVPVSVKAAVPVNFPLVARGGEYRPYVPVAQRGLPKPPQKELVYCLGFVAGFVVLWAFMILRPWQKDEVPES